MTSHSETCELRWDWRKDSPREGPCTVTAQFETSQTPTRNFHAGRGPAGGGILPLLLPTDRFKLHRLALDTVRGGV